MSSEQAAYKMTAHDDEDLEEQQMREYLAMMQGGESPPVQTAEAEDTAVDDPEEAPPEEVESEQPIKLVATLESAEPTVDSKPLPVLELIEVNNPEFVSYSQELLDMFKLFVAEIRIPSITYETFCNYLCTCVEVIYNAKANGTSDRNLQTRFVIGMADGKLAGFFLCYMLPNRMPHIATMDIPYIYSANPHLTAAFGAQINKYKKLWKARHIQMIATNDRIAKFHMRIFKGAKKCGTYIFGYKVRPEWIRMSKTQE